MSERAEIIEGASLYVMPEARVNEIRAKLAEVRRNNPAPGSMEAEYLQDVGELLQSAETLAGELKYLSDNVLKAMEEGRFNADSSAAHTALAISGGE